MRGAHTTTESTQGQRLIRTSAWTLWLMFKKVSLTIFQFFIQIQLQCCHDHVSASNLLSTELSFITGRMTKTTTTLRVHSYASSSMGLYLSTAGFSANANASMGYYDPYVAHSGFPRSLSGTGSGPQHMFPRSYNECYSAGLWAKQCKHGHSHRGMLGLNSEYTNIHCRLDLQHKQNALWTMFLESCAKT